MLWCASRLSLSSAVVFFQFSSFEIYKIVGVVDLCDTKSHFYVFVIISGDSDFSPLVSKLRENAKTVIGIGVKKSTSDLFISNCDEFIYYDDLVRVEQTKRRPSGVPATRNAKPPPEKDHGSGPTIA